MDNVNLYSDTVNINTEVNTDPVIFNYDYSKVKAPGRDLNAISKVEIKFSCKNLPNLDAVSKSDCRIFVYFQERKYENNQIFTNWVKIGSTETIKDNLNPEFSKSFIFDYYFECIQNLRFVIMDMDEECVNMEDNDYIGYVEVSIGDMITKAKDNACCFKINNDVPLGMKLKKNSHNTKNSELKVYIEILKDNNLYALMDICGKNLDKKDLFGKSDPYFIVSKKTADGKWLKVYQSTMIRNTLNPSWPKVDIPLLQLNSGDDKRLLKWDVYDWDKDTDPDYIGGFEATFEEIKQKKEFELINNKKVEKSEKKKEKDGKKYKNSGLLIFNRIDIKEEQSFSCFTLGGTEIAVDFAIDFTGSNGDPDEETSLHYINPKYDPMDFYSMNDYQKAISAIGYVLEPYDSNKLIGAYGYGGCFNKSDTPEFSHPLTNDPDKPNVLGTRGVLDIYTHALKNVKLYGPTNFAPMIGKIRDESEKNVSDASINGHRILLKYNILVFITDGAITDMEETLNEIKTASSYPMSIIIIGVGSADFDKMKKLDGDDRTSEFRDIVQFVPLNEFIDNPSKIAAETLAEVPFQLTSYARKNDIYPPFAVRSKN
ncbi:Copine-domain-containing protein [Piromyces finnis]|uniref:Copine-domain-containing protein n=1 Tax=Piromyces finnis TaxID=1754191 RepID=A0A1Y1VBR1_9FUNG|nr:Copine-domain-containing protein [Piromyces finnis]|eukprot:ORX52100.1 Copine-domain-containing protein [Piromyces finnis]